MSPWFYLLACTGGPDADAEGTSGGEGSAASAGTLVHVAKAETRAMHELVTAPGRTAALREVHVRAPFAGTLATLTVVAGTTVRAHQVVAVLHSSEAVAAEAGARALRAKAKTETEIAEAERAVALAESSDVTWPLEAPEAGVVLELAAGPGDHLSEDDDVLTLSPSDALYFRADMSQRDLLRVRIGQHAKIRLQSREDVLDAVLQGALPTADGDALAVPARLDFAAPLQPPVVGLFGEADVIVREDPAALVVPRGAVLRDDIEGTERVARVSDGKAHWIDVHTGIAEGDRVQVEAEGLQAGDDVIESGQVGLPDDAPVRIAP